MADQYPVLIIILGISYRLLASAEDPLRLWSMLYEGKSAWSDIPAD